LITPYGIDITVQYIPRHITIPGNEKAEKLSKAGAAMTQTSTNETLNTCKRIMRNYYKTEKLISGPVQKQEEYTSMNKLDQILRTLSGN
jgi:hypothetical protein